jgi:hypothetical protein
LPARVDAVVGLLAKRSHKALRGARHTHTHTRARTHAHTHARTHMRVQRE